MHEAAWLIAIHAISKPTLLKRVLAILEQALPKGEPVANEYAKLYDRIELYQGRSQLYGTQFFPSPHGYVAKNLFEPENVDKRRAALGLSTFLENKKEVGAVDGGFGQGGYVDEITLKKEEESFEQFLKEVGWK